jgi:ribosomal protein S18 acetylase RimI-like enzyme
MPTNDAEENRRDHRDNHTITIRQATTADAAALARVHIDTWRTTYRGIVPDSYLDAMSYERGANNWANRIQEAAESKYFIYVAVDTSEQVAGFISGGPNRIDDPFYKGELYAIYILQSCQGQGIGRLLTQALVKSLLAANIQPMMLWVFEKNASARRFYESIGGQFLKTNWFEINGVPLEEVAYGWPDLRVLLKGEEQ